MKNKEILYCIAIALLVFCLLRVDFLNDKSKELKKTTTQEIDQESCMPVTLSGAGTPDLRADANLKFDMVVCQNESGQAVIHSNYDVFINDMIAENEEWK